jgi:hypothetical protein
MHLVNDEMKGCIAECLPCYQTCLSTAMGHCLETAANIPNQGTSLDDGLRRDLSDVRAFHASRLETSQTHLSRMRRDL